MNPYKLCDTCRISGGLFARHHDCARHRAWEEGRASARKDVEMSNYCVDCQALVTEIGELRAKFEAAKWARDAYQEALKLRDEQLASCVAKKNRARGVAARLVSDAGSFVRTNNPTYHADVELGYKWKEEGYGDG